MIEVLYVTEDIDSEINQTYIDCLKKLKYKIYIISNNNKENLTEEYKQLNFSKRFFSFKNIKTYIILKKIIKQNNYNIIHCNNFIPGILTRLASKKEKAKIIYSTNSFLFYKKKSHIKGIINYLIEKYLSKYTDILVTGNKEDYMIAKTNFCTKTVKLFKIIQTNNKQTSLNIKREKFHLKNNDYIFLNVGELNKNENQIIQLEAMIYIHKRYPQAKLIILGKGNQKEYLENIVEKYGLSKNVIIIDNMKNKQEYLHICDCFLQTCINRGNSKNILEAMIRKKAIIATNTKENIDLLKPRNLFEVKNVEMLKNKMEEYITKNKRIEQYHILDKYKLENIQKEILKIYK